MLKKTYNFSLIAKLFAFFIIVFSFPVTVISQPNWVWAKGAHTNSDEYAKDIAVDPVSGTVVIVGFYNSSLSSFYGSNFSGSAEGGFVAKYDSIGNVIWGFKVGSNQNNSCNGVAIDSAGDIYITGSFELTTNFQGLAFLPSILIATGGKDVFLAKYNSSGQLIWVIKGGGLSNDAGNSVCVNSSGVFITGYYTNSGIFGSSTSVANNSNQNVFTLAYNLSGSQLWFADGGASQSSSGNDITADNTAVYLTGEFNGASLNIYNSSGALASTLTNAAAIKKDAYVLSYTTSGAYNWSGLVSSNGDEYGRSITEMGSYIYITGSLTGNANFPGYALNPLSFSGSNKDMYVAQLNKNNGEAQWAKNETGNELEGLAIETDGSSAIYVCGYFKNSLSFNGGPTLSSSGGNEDVFVVSYSSSGSYLWARIAGDNDKDIAHGISVRASNEVYICGEYNESPSFGSSTLVSDDDANIFIAKLTCYFISNNIIAGTQSICAGLTPDSLAGLSPGGTTGPFVYTWEQSTDTVSWVTASGTSNLQSYFPPALMSSTYFRRKVFSSTACHRSISNTVFISVIPQPTLSNAGPGQTLCSFYPTVVMNANIPTVGTGSWTNVSGNGTIVTPASPTTTINGLAIGTNIFQWTISNGVCPASVSNVTITVDQMPTTSNAGADQTICILSNLVAMSANQAVVGVGSWSISSGAGSIAAPASPVTGISNLGIGNNIFTWTISNGVCPASISNVTITADQVPTTSNAGADQTVCISSTLAAMNANVPVIGVGSWSNFSGAGSIAAPASPVTVINNPGIGNNIFTWTISNGVCPASVSNVTITADQVPTTSNAGADQTVCISSTLVAMNANVPVIGVGSWSNFSGAGSIVTPASPVTVINNPAIGNNIFTWTISNGVCPASISNVSITVDQIPDTAYAGQDLSVDVPFSVLNGNVPVTGNGYWTLISGNALIDNPSNASTSISQLAVEIHVLRWTISNGSCPASIDDITITLKPLNISNGFSPNDDGINDFFVVPGLEYYSNVKFTAFNKWGNAVYDNNDYKNQWNGINDQNEKLTDDTYYFLLEITPEMKYNGFVVIKRK